MDEMDERSFILFFYLCAINQLNSETMNKKVDKKFGSPRIFPYICHRIAT